MSIDFSLITDLAWFAKDIDLARVDDQGNPSREKSFNLLIAVQGPRSILVALEGPGGYHEELDCSRRPDGSFTGRYRSFVRR